MQKDAKIYVIGAETAVGAAIVRELDAQGYARVFGSRAPVPTSSDGRKFSAESAKTPDLLSDPGDEDTVETSDSLDEPCLDDQLQLHQPDYLFIAAGKSGGIEANRSNPVQLMLDNLRVVVEALPLAHRHGVKKLLYLASSCTYPRDCPQPMKEKDLFAGPPEPTSAAYATAKRTGIRLCEAYNAEHGTRFIPAIPANPFGPGEDFERDTAHVVEALIRTMHEAELEQAPYVDVWGSGAPVRDFIFIDDLARAAVHVMNEYTHTDPINIGTGERVSIRELAYAIKLVTGYSGDLRFDITKPDGMPVKVLDNSKLLSLGWRQQRSLMEALNLTYSGYSERFANAA